MPPTVVSRASFIATLKLHFTFQVQLCLTGIDRFQFETSNEVSQPASRPYKVALG